MQKRDINLMPEEIQAGKRRQERRRLLILGSIALAMVAASLTAAVLAFVTILQSDTEVTKAAIEQEKAKIEKFEETENSAKRLKLKADAVSSILRSRDQYSLLLQTFTDISPEDVEIVNLGVSGNVVSISGVAKSYVAVAKFLIVSVEEEKGGIIFTSTELNSVSLDSKTGEARFAITLVLKEGALKNEG